MIHLLATVFSVFALAAVAGAQTLRVYVIDVGQGSSTLIVSPTGVSMLIDGGPDQSGWISSTNSPGPVAQLLTAAGVSQLDYTVLTHYHSDHYEGLTEIAQKNYLKTTAKAYDRGNTPAPENGFTSAINTYISAMGAKRTTMTPGLVINMGGGVTVTCKVAGGQIAGGPLVDTSASAQEENSNSLGVVVVYNNFEMWVGGDLTGGGGGTTNVENILAPFVGDVDVYIANHHGSSTSSSPNWVNNLLPEVSIASCGVGNSFNHPSGTFLNNVNKSTRSTLVYSTTSGADGSDGFGNRGFVNADGTIFLQTDGNLYEIAPPVGKPQRIVCDELSSGYAQSAANDLRITEFMPDPNAVPDDAGEWFEITNTSGFVRNIAGLKVSQSDGTSNLFTIATPLLLNPGERFVFCRSGDSLRNGGVVADFSPPFNVFILDSTDSILLRNSSNTNIDSLSYNTSWPDSTGIAAQRTNLLGATNTVGNWSAATVVYGGGDRGTPGSKNTGDTTVFPAQFVSTATPVINSNWNVNFTSFNEPGDIYIGVLSESTSSPFFTFFGLNFPVQADGLLFESLNFPGFIEFLNPNGFGSATVFVPNDPLLHGFSFFGCVGVLDFPTLAPGKMSAVVPLTIP